MESNTFFIGVGLAILFLMVPAMWRMSVGPTALDRIVAVNVIGTKTAVLLVVIGQIFVQVEMFVDFALAYALLNFTGSLAAARYLHKTKSGSGRPIVFDEPEPENHKE
ncbi:monovalent cation/H+ antiporter complex subunit F [Verrucomicrobiales bacterium]|jgi:multicomponent Na+:H+ antiporter subunit F|nr:monovalent cation/H+ antiporter complex subunit F [Verrucomicrobiales bacterium]MDA7926600.1 monovalent cation/H+ antiporter complex subunit F [Verrucomicrobiales bacterium]